MLAGEYPGDGKPKPFVFHDPARTAVRGSRVAIDPSVRAKYEEPAGAGKCVQPPRPVLA